MPGISFRVTGKLFSDGERAALLLTDGGRRFNLRLGLVLHGSEEHFLPETLLDDWGHEIGGAELYHWVKENGPHFPRAELFGQDPSGQPQQCFVRDLDPTAKYICYIIHHDTGAVDHAIRIDAIILPIENTSQRRLNLVPAHIPFPMRQADVVWWALDPELARRSAYNFFDNADNGESG